MVVASAAGTGGRRLRVPGQRRSGDESGHQQGSHHDGQRPWQAHGASHAAVPHRGVEGTRRGRRQAPVTHRAGAPEPSCWQ
jgi:hypothetical protein